LTEENLLSKMTEFMTTLDQVKKYRQLASAMIDFALIVVASVVILLAVHITVNLLNLYGVSGVSLESWVVAFANVVVVCLGVFVGVVWVGQKMDRVKTQQWKNTLNEGTPGALKLLQNTNWETIFNDIRFAKLGFALYGLIKVAAYWLITISILVVLSSLIGNIIHLNFDFIALLVIALVLVVTVNLKDIRNRYDQVGRLDALLWELRWFESEFRRTDFKT